MYHIAVYFDVPLKRRQDFINAALEDGRRSLAKEPGTKRLELIEDEQSRLRFYLNEAYEDKAAFERHVCGPYFQRFFEIIGEFAIEGPHLIEGTQIEDSSLDIQMEDSSLDEDLA
jgi:autoinducer 2-degrading protein